MNADISDVADVVVVGGGIVGVAAAYYLARAGQRVTLIERGVIAGEASGRNGGHLSPTADGAWAPLGRLALDLWPQLVGEIDGPTEYCRGGGLFVMIASDPAEPTDRLVFRRERGFVAELMSPEDCRRLLPGLTSELKGGVLSPLHGHVNPLLTTKSLARAAERLGVRTRLHTSVTGVILRNGNVEGVETSNGRVSAPVVVNAAGAWAAELARLAGVDCPVSPRRIQILMSDRVERVTDLVWGGHGLYARQAHAGQLHFGSGGPEGEPPVLGFDHQLSPLTMQHTARLMLELMPGLADLPILRSWSGTIGPSADGEPILDALASPRGFILATGFGGNGFVTGPAVGQIVADLVVHGATPVDISGLRLDRFGAR